MIDRLDELRRRAEAALRYGETHLGHVPVGVKFNLSALLEELRIYQAELELQNSELIEAQAKADQAHRYYATLFNRLPLPALVVDSQGVIHEANEVAYQQIDLALLNEYRPYSLLRILAPQHDPALSRLFSALSTRNTELPQDIKVALRNRQGYPTLFGLHCYRLDEELGATDHALLLLVDLSAETQLAEREQRLNNVIWGTGVGTWEWNVQTEETIFNERWAEMLDYTLAELSPTSIHTWIQLTHPDDLPQAQAALHKHWSGELDRYECELRMRHKAGHWIWVQDRGRVISRTASGEPLWMAGTHLDITRRKQTQAALRDSEEKYRTLFDQSMDAIYLHDEQGQFLDANPKASIQTGYSRDELLQLDVLQLNANPHMDHQSMLQRWQAWQPGDPPMQVETQHRRKDGTAFYVEIHIARIQFGTVNCFLAIVRDITQRKLNEEQLLQLSIIDPLTNLFNRRHFFKLAQYECDTPRRYRRPLALIMADIDHFKKINDVHGHPVGDEVLRIVASALKQNLRQTDIIGRYGGEEFVMLLPETDFTTAQASAERLRLTVAQWAIHVPNGLLTVTLSLGVAVFAGDKVATLDELLQTADQQLYEAKRTGRNRVSITAF